MNLLRSLASFFLPVLLCLSGAHAATVTFASSSTAADPNQSNSLGANVAIAPNPAWTGPLAGSNYVSYRSTGDPSASDFFVVPNGTVVSFFQNFILSGIPAGGTVSVLADDSTSVVLNGTTLVPEATMTNNTYGTCSDFTPNCITPVTVVLPTALLVNGANTLRFDVAQRAGTSFGLDYVGSASTVPEPSTFFLLGGAAMCALATRCLRRQNR